MEKAIICGPHIGELGWEVLRVAPFALYKKITRHSSQAKLIVFTREDRFDLYGEYADIFVPLRIEGDFTKYKSNCFRLDHYPVKEYDKLINIIYRKYSSKFNIVDHVYPRIKGKDFLQKDQFNANHMFYEFKPRHANKQLVDSYIPKDKPLVTLSPRFREGMKRNWPHWQTFFDILSQDKLRKKFNFVICGRPPEYIPDEENRFFDVNKIVQNENSSLIGLTIEILKRSVLCVGSQSGLPNLSNLLKTPTLQWGHQKWFHEKTYNIMRTPTTFINDQKYQLKPELLLKTLRKSLRGKEKTNVE